MNQKLNVACFGNNGHQILGKLKGHLKARLAAVGKISPQQVEKNLGSEAASTVKFIDDLDSIINDEEIDLISLCSPRRDQQCDHAIECLLGGKHVLAEKPAAFTISQLDKLRAVAAESSTHFRQMGSCGEEKILVAIRELVDSGELGEIVHVFAQKSYPYHDGRPQDRGIDGGLIRQAGIHGVRFIQWATGLRATRTSGIDTTTGNPKKGRLQMASSVSLELENGAVASLLCNYLNPNGIGYWGNDQLRVFGTKGMVEAVDGFNRCRMILGEHDPQPIPNITDEFPDFFDTYVDFITRGTPMPYSPDDDLYALQTVIRSQEAVDSETILDI
ncbi:MAG: Gfo/Idh/MocA family oxidoreductase [Planctomycetes bacterium]|nr:Gfo/Idh/MocA family oxidoreductase [Planctomycetota bacterium]